MSIIKTEKLSKFYNSGKLVVDALKDVSISIEKGRFVTITGASGSGKTTLLLILAGLIRPSSGKAWFGEKELTHVSDNELAFFRRKNVGFIMQSFALIPYLSCVQNVMLPLSLNKISKEKQMSIAKDVLANVGLENRMGHLPRELSAGQQQRVAIARALVNSPSVIFADEPTGNLDPVLSLEILNFLKKINQQKNITVVMVTHSPVAAGYGNVRIHLDNGSIIIK